MECQSFYIFVTIRTHATFTLDSLLFQRGSNVGFSPASISISLRTNCKGHGALAVPSFCVPSMLDSLEVKVLYPV